MNHAEKTEAMVVGTAARQRTEGAAGSIDLGGTRLIPSHSVRSKFGSNN